MRKARSLNLRTIEDLKEYLGLIRDEAFRCKQITHGLLDFSRLRAGNRVPVNLADTIKMTARLVTHQQRGDNTFRSKSKL